MFRDAAHRQVRRTLRYKMKSIPKLFQITGKNALAKTILYYKISLVILVLCIFFVFFSTIYENRIFLFINQAITIALINLIVCFNSNPTLKINPLFTLSLLKTNLFRMYFCRILWRVSTWPIRRYWKHQIHGHECFLYFLVLL